MTVVQRLSSARPVPARFTAEEFMELAQHSPMNEWAGKVELVNGEILRMSPAGTQHWNTQRLLNMQLTAIYAALDAEWVVGAEATVRLSTGTARVIDIAVLRAPDLTRQGALDRADLFLAIEIADTTLRNDLGPKLRDHAEAGVPHYWVLDLRKHETHAMSTPDGQTYASRMTIPFGEPLAVPGTDATITLS